VREFLEGLYTLGELTPEERLDALYQFLKALPERATRREVYALFSRMPRDRVDRVLRILDFADILYVWRGVIAKTDLAKAIEARGRLTLADFSKAPSWVLRTLTRRAVRAEIRIGDDTSTGYDIYYSLTRHCYLLEENKRIIKAFRDLGLILTFSIDTEGHERLVCEIASWTWVHSMHPSRFKEVESTLANFIREVLLNRFGLTVPEAAIKGGLEYMSETGTYISEETNWEYPVDFVPWPEAKCVVEYIHQRKVVSEEKVLYKPTGSSGKIVYLLSEWRRRYPEPLQSPRRKSVQTTIPTHLRR